MIFGFSRRRFVVGDVCYRQIPMGARTSTRSEQLILPLYESKRGSGTNGGRRQRHPDRARVKHRVRAIAKRWPMHVVIRVREENPSLRCAGGWAAVRGALSTQLRRRDFRICHISVQRMHVHLMVETDNAKELASGMGGFQIALAKRIDAWLGTRGEVFSDRYFATPLRTPARVRHALSYILNNWRKHGEDRAERSLAAMDPYSSAGGGQAWREFRTPSEDRRWRCPIATPQYWGLTTGWTRHGPSSFLARPLPS